MIDKIVRQAGLEHTGYHALRFKHASNLICDGYPIQLVSKCLDIRAFKSLSTPKIIPMRSTKIKSMKVSQRRQLTRQTYLIGFLGVLDNTIWFLFLKKPLHFHLVTPQQPKFYWLVENCASRNHWRGGLKGGEFWIFHIDKSC